MSEPTPLYEEEDDNGAHDTCIYYVDAEPTPGRSPRLDLPVPVGVEDYSSAHAPFGALAPRLARGDLTVFDEMSAADLHNEYPLGSVVGRAIIHALETVPALGPPVLAALDAVPEKLRAAIQSRIVAYLHSAKPETAELYASSALFEPTLVEIRARTTQQSHGESPPPYVPSFDWHRDAKQLAVDANLAVRTVEDGAAAYLVVNPGAIVEVIVALESAIADTHETLYVRLGAVRQLAKLDRAYLVKLAATPVFDDPALASVAGPLRLCPAPGELARRMRELGLVPSDDQSDAITVHQVFEACGRATTFNCETDVYPNHHDSVLAELAALVSPLLDDVIFEEVPHRPDWDAYAGENDDDDDGGEPADPDMLPEAYRLRAFLPDGTYEVIAGDTSDWYDVPAMLGLLNVLCRARGSSLRFFELPSGSQDAIVAAAPLEAIRAARTAGLLTLATPGAAATSGRQFESAVISQLLQRD